MLAESELSPPNCASILCASCCKEASDAEAAVTGADPEFPVGPAGLLGAAPCDVAAGDPVVSLGLSVPDGVTPGLCSAEGPEPVGVAFDTVEELFMPIYHQMPAPIITINTKAMIHFTVLVICISRYVKFLKDSRFATPS